MDGSRFDEITRQFAGSRRGFLKSLLGAAGGAVLGTQSAHACVALGEACTQKGDACCAGRCTGKICSCKGSESACGGQCIDPRSDATNCGGCGIICPSGQQCKNGGCGCPGRTEPCNGICLDTLSDVSNCGGCGIACASGEICQNGRCRCPGGMTLCGGACISTNADPTNCGGCGIVCTSTSPCSSPVCSSGACVESSAADGTPCDDGNPCTQGDTCQNGACVGGSQVTCDAPDACHLAGQCNQSTGGCSYPFADSGTPCGACQICDGNGVCVASSDPCCGVICDTPPSVCHEAAGTCSNGSCTYAQLGYGAPCGICHRCDDDGGCNPVDEPGIPNQDCQITYSCFVSPGFCRTGFCNYHPAEPGVPCGDCLECDGWGQCIPIQCCGVVCDSPPLCHHGTGTCRGDVCRYDPDLYGTPCGKDSICDGEGACIDDPCTVVTCNTPPSDCYHVPGTCWHGFCTYEVLPPGSPCDDCHQCDGAGTCAGTQDLCCDVVCNDPPGPCFEDIGYCADGDCFYIPRAQSSYCGTCQRCNANGACLPFNGTPTSSFPDCVDEIQCYVSPGHCFNGFCQHNAADPGTACGNCGECDGLGSCMNDC